MKNLSIIIMLIISGFTTSCSAQFDQFVSNEKVQTASQFQVPGSGKSNIHSEKPPFQNSFMADNPTQAVSENINTIENSHSGIIISPAPVPSDLLNLTGRWINEKNDCIAALQWDGEKWLGTTLPESNNPHITQGEIILELYPKSEKEVYGRMMVVKKKGKIEWKDVKYKLSLTKMKGSYEWKFYRK